MSDELLDEGDSEENAERWLLTYSDMITLMMAFFIMMYAMSKVDAGKFSAMATSVRTEFAGSGLPSGDDMLQVNAGLATSLGIINGTQFGLRENIKKSLDKTLGKGELRQSIQVLERDGNLILRMLDSRFLFASGSAELTGRNRKLLDKISPILRVLPYQVRIEGHTDNVPINTARYPSNWELSTARASSVVMYLVRKQAFSPDRFSIAGYADTNPVTSNETAKGRSINRRIDMIIFTQPATAPKTNEKSLETIGSEALDSPVDERSGIVPPINILSE